MNFENPPAEKEPQFLSLEAIKLEIEKLSSQENLETVRTLEDEKGVYLYEAAVIDEKGDGFLYSYRRVGNYAETKTATTVIDLAYFVGKLEDEMFIGGKTLSNYNEETGQWTDAK